MKNKETEKRARTTDEEIQLYIVKEEGNKQIKTTDEEMTLRFMYEDEHVTRHPEDYEQIEY